MSAAASFPSDLDLPPAPGHSVPAIPATLAPEALVPHAEKRIMRRIYHRGDRIVSRFLLLHAGIAGVLSFAYDTWFAAGVVTLCALLLFAVSKALLPGSAVTRHLAGVSLQTFVALHIYQMHGLAEMHFFFFSGFTVLIVYQDWKCLWAGAIGIILQHLAFAIMHNSGINVYFFEQSFVSISKLAFHFGIALGHVGVCAYWAQLMRRQTLHDAVRNAQLQSANTHLRSEMAERQEAKAELQRVHADYLRLIANVPGMVYQFRRNPEGAFSFPFVSDGCIEVFGVQPQEASLDSQAILRLIHQDDFSSLLESISQSASALTPWTWEGRLALPGGQQRWIRGFSRPIRHPEGSVVWDGIVVDVTAAKAVEAELRVAKNEADRANLAKSEFLSRMSHELRTPLNSILGFGQLLELEPLNNQQQQSVKHVLKGGNHLLSLINEVLDIARIEAGRLEFSLEPIAIHPLVEEAISLVRPLAQQRQIRLVILDRRADLTLHVRSDLQRLKQVLLNLLSNAIKYNRQEGTVTVSWRELPAGEGPQHAGALGCLRLEIHDTGWGISPELLPRLFTPFDRLGAEREGIEGSGIGLALSKCLVEAMHGEIGVHSTPGQGSTFYINLPIMPAPAQFSGGDVPGQTWPRPHPISEDETPLHTVLQIEDNLANRRVIESVLALRPRVRLLSAIQGRIGLELAREHRPDLILLDLNLPDLPGSEILVRLRADPQTAHIPVVVLSADATPHQIQRVLSLGAHEYLTKPFLLPQLMSVLDDLLEAPETEPTATV